MNHPFMIDAARSTLARPDVAGLFGEYVQGRSTVPFALRPIPERRKSSGRLASFSGESATDPRRWQMCTQALLMANEFVFVD